MFIHLTLIIVLSTYIIDTGSAHFLASDKTSHVAENNDDLIKIIQSLNRINEELKSTDEDYNKLNDIAETKELNDEEKEKKLQQLLRILKKNYKAQKQGESSRNSMYSGARLYFIRNPEVIEEYKNHLKRMKHHPSIIMRNDNREKKRGVKNKLQELRRNVMVRLTQATNEQSDEDNLDRKQSNLADEKQLYDVYRKRKQDSYEPLKEDPLKRKLPLDSLELHNVKAHKRNVRTDNDSGYKRDKFERDDRSDQVINDNMEIKKWNTKRADNFKSDKSLETYKYSNSKMNKDKFKTNDAWDTPTTRNWVKSEFKKKNDKIQYDEPKYKPKIIYRNPKSEKIKDDFFLYGRTSIPYVGKKGIYEEE